MSIEASALQQLIKEVAEHRNTTEQELDAVADILQRFGTRLVALEAEVDRLLRATNPPAGVQVDSGLGGSPANCTQQE